MPLTRQQEAIAIGALQGPVGRQLRSEMNYSTNAKMPLLDEKDIMILVISVLR